MSERGLDILQFVTLHTRPSTEKASLFPERSSQSGSPKFNPVR